MKKTEIFSGQPEKNVLCPVRGSLLPDQQNSGRLT